MRQAFKSGIRKVPESLALYALLTVLGVILAAPGALLFLYGLLTHNLILQGVGAALAGLAVFGVMLTSYFAPISVVIGEHRFARNVRTGFRASRDEQKHVFLLTVFSFGTLLLTNFLQGSLAQIGLLGFVLSRLIAAVIGVYMMLVNPKLFLETR